jgi:hypothetical protein
LRPGGSERGEISPWKRTADAIVVTQCCLLPAFATVLSVSELLKFCYLAGSLYIKQRAKHKTLKISTR